MTLKHNATLVFLEKVEKAPAADLMRLSHAELESWTNFARKIEERAQNAAGWLSGLKIEKALREEASLSRPGGGK